MSGLNRGVLVALLVAALAVGFGAGRWMAPPAADAPPADLAAAIRAALAESDVLDRQERTTRLLQHLGPEDLPEVVAIYDDMLAVLDKWDIRPFVVAWTRFDPAAAFDHALAWPIRIKQEVGAESAIYGWALRDPLAARLAYEQAAPEHRHLDDGLFFSLLSGWVGSGGSGIERYLAELSPVRRTRATGRTIGAIVRQRGTEATLRWADAILREASYDQEFKETVFRNSTRSVARLEPERAAAWAVAHDGQSYAADAPRIVAEQWATRDGGAAMDWLRERPDGTPRDQGVREALVRWMRSDPEAAKAWLDAESLSDFHDPALDAYARLRDARVPEEAIGWCERILDAELRLPCLQAAATEWYRQDAVAAETWLQQSPLSEDARRAARTPPKRRGRANPGAGATRAGDADAAEDES